MVIMKTTFINVTNDFSQSAGGYIWKKKEKE
jgi:hypothetical protein